MKKIKKLLVAILVLALCATMFPLSALAVEPEYLASVTTADNTVSDFTSWEDAIDYAELNADSTLKMLADCNDDNCVNMPAFNTGKLTLDINGYVFSKRIIVKNADLTVIDSASEKGTLVNVSGNAFDYKGGKITLDDSVDVMGYYNDAEPIRIFNCTANTLTLGTEIVIPEKFELYSNGFGAGAVTIEPGDIVEIYDGIEKIIIGDVRVTIDNYNDIFGDGTAKLDKETNTLYLDGADITGNYFYEDDYANTALFSNGSLNIQLAEGSVNKISINEGIVRFAAYVRDELSIAGNGTIIFEANNENLDALSCAGVYAAYIDVDGSNVIATGADVSVDDGFCESVGIEAYGLTGRNGASITAEGGNIIEALDGLSFGVYIDDGFVHINDATLKAIAGNANGLDSAVSSGVYLTEGQVNIIGVNAVVDIKTGTATTLSDSTVFGSEVLGLVNFGGSIYINDAAVAVTTGEAIGARSINYGIFAAAYQDSTGAYVEGDIIIESDEVVNCKGEPGFDAANLNVRTADGIAIWLGGDFVISDNLEITLPEVATLDADQDDVGYVFYDENNEVADCFNAQLATYEVTFDGLESNFTAYIPVGNSINEIYCEKYDVDDFTDFLKPEKEGYTFEGFYADADFTTPMDFDKELEGDTTVYLKWAKIIVPEDAADPEIPDTQIYVDNIWCFAMLISALGVALVLVTTKKREYTK